MLDLSKIIGKLPPETQQSLQKIADIQGITFEEYALETIEKAIEDGSFFDFVRARIALKRQQPDPDHLS